MDKKLRILILEDVPADAELQEHELRKAGLVFTSKVVDTREAFLKELDEFLPDLILSDYDLPSFDGLAALRIAKGKCPDMPFILVTGKLGEEFAIEKLKEGATDYVLKSNLKRLVPSVNGALEEAKLITDRKRAVQELRLSERNLKAAQKIAHVGSWDLDVVTGNLTWSDETYRIYGFEPQEFVPTYKKFLSILHPEDHEWVQKQVDAALSGEAEYDVDFRFVLPDGKIGWIYCNGEVTRDEQGKPLRFFGTQIDITERKQAEEALRQSEERYRKQFKEAIDAIFLADLETGMIVDCNIAASKLVEREKSEIIGKHQSFLHPAEEIKNGFSKTFKSHMTGESSELLEDRVITKSGQIKDVAIRASKITIEGKEVMQGIFRDITERKQAEEAFRKELEFNQSILNTAQAIILVLDVNGYIVRFNPYMEEISGYRLDEVKGKEWFSTFLSKRDQDKIRELFHESISDIKTKGNINPIITKDGQEIDIEWYDTTIKDEYGQMTGVVSIGQDITERKQAQEALRESEEKYRLLFEGESDAILVFDGPLRKIIDVNTAAQKLYGYSREEFLNMQLKDVAAQPEESEKTFQIALTGKLLKVPLKYHRKKDGTVFPVEISAGTFLLRGQTIVIGAIRDVTEHKKAEEEIRLKMSEIESLNKLFIGREHRMIELKKEVNALLEKMGQPKKYDW